MAMPKATMNEDCPSPGAVSDIRRAWQIAVVYPESVAECMKQSANAQLSRCAVLSHSA
jgi:hypothetical protein